MMSFDEDALVDVLAHVGREYAPGVRLGPRDVDEVVEEQVRALLADELGRDVEVVVVEHHHRVVVALDLLEHRPREVLVDRAVALLVGHDLVAPDVGRVREVPEVMLDEPQHRVRHHVVEAVVRLRVARHELHPVVVAVQVDLERSAAVLFGDLGVLIRHCRGHPDGVAVMDEPLQRGHETAAATRRLSILEGRRAAVRYENERGLSGHRWSRKSLSQSRRSRGVRKWVRTCSLP